MDDDPTTCPRCGAKLEWFDGWEEYGDRAVEVKVLGCGECGYQLDEDDHEERPASTD